MTDFNCECVDENSNLTLAEYRVKMLQRAGFAAVASNPPPGTAALFNTFLQDAQDFLYRKYPALRTRRFFRWSLQQGERFYGLRENNDGWTDLDVQMTVGSPGLVLFDDAPPEDGTQIMFWQDTDPLPGEVTPYKVYYIVDRDENYNSARIALTEGGDPIDFDVGGDVKAAIPPEGTTCIFNLEPYKEIEGAWLVDLNGQWLPMACGIPPTFYTTVNQPALPQRYEIRQCIEIYPAPQAAGYQFYIKGHFDKRPFTADSDKPTMNGELVYLWALANALDYYGKPSAAGVAEQAKDLLGQLTAGTHTGKRYVPGTKPISPALMPVYVPYPGNTP